MYKLGKPIVIGYTPENNAREFEFDISAYRAKWPDAQPQMLMQRRGDTVPYIVDAALEGDVLTWCVSRYDTATPGDGKMWVVFVSEEDELLGLTPSTQVRVLAGPPTLDASEPPPTEAPWVAKVLEAAERIEQGGGGGSGTPGEDGGYYTPNVTDDGILTWKASKDGMPEAPSANVKGKDGAPGKDGADGYTPVKGVDYFDGADGKDGADGAPGEKGDKGDKGDTPQKGVDYWTAADREQIVSDVLAALPNASGVGF